MKRKTIVWAYLLVLSLGTILSLYIPKNEVAAKDAIVIPGQAIRLRILANSDLESDQALKRKVRDAVNAKISVWVQDLTSMTEARKVIKAKLPTIEKTAEEVVKQEGSNQAVKVKFGKVQFPTKLYGQFLYPAGEYEAILITLGEGNGANWWCVLFPPLCFLDFSNGVAVSKGFEEKKTAAKAKHETKRELTAEDQADEEPTGKTSDKAAGKSNSKVNGEAPNTKANEESPEAPNTKADGESLEAPNTKADDESLEAPNTKADDESLEAPNAKANDESLETPIAKAEDDSDIELETKGKGSTEKHLVAAVPNRVQKQMQAEEVVQAAALGTIEETAKHKHAKKDSEPKNQAPVYTSGDEEPVKVKFFIVELWNKIF